MSDRLCALLVRRGRPLEVGQVVAQVLRLRGLPAHAAAAAGGRTGRLGRAADVARAGPRGPRPAALGVPARRRGDVLHRRSRDHRRQPGHVEDHRDRRRARRGPPDRRPLLGTRRSRTADSGDDHPPDGDHQPDGRRTAGDRRGAGDVRGFRPRRRAGGAQRPVRSALSDLRAPPYRRALLHPALARHAHPCQAPAGGTRRSPRPCDALRVGRYERAADSPRAARCRGDGGVADPFPGDARRPRDRYRRARRRDRGPRRNPPLVEAGARGRPANRPGHLSHAQSPRGRPVCRQGAQPAPSGAVVFRPRRPARAADRAGARAAGAHRLRVLRLGAGRAASRAPGAA